jgi:hypothetical protein
MSFREALSLPPDCSLRKDFPDGEVYVQMSGVEGPDGPAHVSLYDKAWQDIPRVPVAHIEVPLGTMADDRIQEALSANHDDLSDGDCGCIALDSLGAVIRRHSDLRAKGQAV